MLSKTENYTFNRWISILLYAFVSPFIVVILSKIKWIKELFDWWNVIFNSFDLIFQCLFAFFIGLVLNKWLSVMYVYGKNSSKKMLWYYPPITVSVILSILILISYNSYITGNTTSIGLYFISDISYIIVSIMLGLAVMLFRYPSTISDSNTLADDTRLLTYNDYKEWFKNDKPISDCSSLSYQLQEYVTRIKERIKSNNDTDTGSHIALFGKFGTGKSSIIECVQKDLGNEFIFSNIDTWGSDSNSINGIVLAKVISDVSSYVDVSALKQLPSQYIDALKIGGNPLKLLAVFSGVSVDPKAGLIKLDNILSTIDKKLIITIQDLDRSSHPLKSCNELSALLDKLKELKNISFIIALSYDSNVSEVIRKVCDYREDLITASYQEKVFTLFDIFINEANSARVCVPLDGNRKRSLSIHKHNYSDPYRMITSERSFKHICRRVDIAWKYDKLMGEINIESLFLFEIIREEFPLVFDFIIKNKTGLIDEIKGMKAAKNSTEEGTLLSKLEDLVSSNFIFENVKYFLKYFFSSSNNLGQGVKNNDDYIDYFERMLLGNVPSHEIRDQIVIELLTKISNGQASIDQLISKFKSKEMSYNWISSYRRFNLKFLKTSSVNEKIYMEMTELYYSDVFNESRYAEMKINDSFIQIFIYDLLNASLTKENAVQLFKQAVKVPTTLSFIGGKGMSSLDLFLCNTLNVQEEIRNTFLSELKDQSEITQQLPITHAGLYTSLADVVARLSKESKEPSTFFKDIILSLKEKNSKSESTYKNCIWFICYMLSILKVDENMFKPCELNKLKIIISELNNDEISEYLHNIENKDFYFKELLGKLEKLEKLEK
ncbi:P-loop NTPase fold protein [Moritella sp. 28]|uniref:P-loop NTPase fold protein n=1 Tax=Moritella sp. 28 TaxID=2746232 RepID=UPI001BAC9851|nr:P-loop NTPase fold protein [Moritella sp. 28]QUM84592.1 hypothetical protein HWV02_08790 [Moritella sp. 28]